MKKKLLVILSLILVLALTACGSDKNDDTKKVKIGVSGSDGEQWPIIKELAAKEGIEIELIEFTDYTLPNIALADGDIDLNSFQHIAFLSQFELENKAGLVPIGSTVIAPLGVYSNKIKDIKEIKKGDKIAIPDDPSNLGRSLLLLESAGFIELEEDTGIFGDLSNIKSNRLDLDIIPMVAQQTPRVMDDVVASIINNGIAGQAGLDPVDDPIHLEDGNDENARPYVNIFAAREEDKDNETLLKIVEFYHTEAVEEAVTKETNGGSLILNFTTDELTEVLKTLTK